MCNYDRLGMSECHSTRATTTINTLLGKNIYSKVTQQQNGIKQASKNVPYYFR